MFIASGGGEYTGKSNPLSDRLYINHGDFNFTKTSLPESFENASIIKTLDADNDGDLDIFIGNHTDTKSFGKSPESYLLLNENTTFNLKSLGNLGMITDATISDFNMDGQQDIIVVGEWMQPTFLQNNNGDFKDVTSQFLKENLKGLWQSIIPFDIDNDGDDDYIVGNFGLNSKFKASKKFPMKMYVGDFDKNKKTETILAIEKNGNYYTLHGLDELASQLTYLKKKYTSYKNFAGQTIENIFEKEKLQNTTLLTVTTLASGYLKNNNGHFTFIPFTDISLQLAPITALLKYDFNADGKNEVLLAGNYFGMTPYHGKFDSFSGAIIQKNELVIPAEKVGVNFFRKAVKGLNIIKIGEVKYLLVTINNDKPQVYKLN